MPTESSPAAPCAAYLACPVGAYPRGGADSHGVAMGCEMGAPLGRVPVGAGAHGVAMGCQKRAPLGRIPVGARVPTAPAIPRHRRKRALTFEGPSLCHAVPAHRRCISLVSPRQRRGETIPNKIRSPERASQMPPFPLSYPRCCHRPSLSGPLHAPEHNLIIYLYKLLRALRVSPLVSKCKNVFS
jgi:hypothetical protein